MWRRKAKFFLYHSANILSSSLLYGIKLKERLIHERSLRVLVYHRISNMPKERKLEYYNVPPRNFERQMEYIAKGGYNVMTIEDFFYQSRRKASLPPKSVAITFDDGFENNYAIAYPILRKFNLTATIFVVTNSVGTKSYFKWLKWDEAALQYAKKDPMVWRPLSWDQITEMSKNGIFIGSHSANHIRLKDIGYTRLDIEIKESKKVLEDKLGKEVISFAYPHGTYSDFDNNVIEMLKTAGYRIACTGQIGANKINNNIYCIKRIPIYEYDSLFTFRKKLDGAYDWLAPFQNVWLRFST